MWDLDKQIEEGNHLVKSKGITDREKEVLTQISIGNESKEISGNLNISKETVKTHRKNMLKKSGAKNMFELVALYSRYFSFPHQNITL